MRFREKIQYNYISKFYNRDSRLKNNKKFRR